MSDYAKTTNFTAKDSTTDLILGAEYDAEYDAIATAIATKEDKVGSPTAGRIASFTAGGVLQDSGTLASQVSTNTTNVATNTADIATNTADITSLETAVAAIEAGVNSDVLLGTAESVGTGQSKTKSLSGTVQEITVTIKGIETSSGSSSIYVALGTGGSIETLASAGAIQKILGTNSCGLYTMGSYAFLLTNPAYITQVLHARATLRHMGSNVWMCTMVTWDEDSGYMHWTTGYCSLTGACDIVGVLAPSNPFTAGKWVVDYRRSA